MPAGNFSRHLGELFSANTREITGRKHSLIQVDRGVDQMGPILAEVVDEHQVNGIGDIEHLDFAPVKA
ncbi:hypothetical protein D3C76_1791740 [compost metagenome]